MMSRKRFFNAISAGLFPAESSQFSKSLIRDPMLDLRLVDGHHDARGAAIGIFAPVVLPESAQCLSHRFVQTLRGDLRRVLDALSVPA